MLCKFESGERTTKSPVNSGPTSSLKRRPSPSLMQRRTPTRLTFHPTQSATATTPSPTCCPTTPRTVMITRTFDSSATTPWPSPWLRTTARPTNPSSSRLNSLPTPTARARPPYRGAMSPLKRARPTGSTAPTKPSPPFCETTCSSSLRAFWKASIPTRYKCRRASLASRTIAWSPSTLLALSTPTPPVIRAPTALKRTPSTVGWLSQPMSMRSSLVTEPLGSRGMTNSVLKVKSTTSGTPPIA